MKSTLLFSASLMGLALGVSSAAAQVSTDSGDSGEIIVTAQKRAERLQDVPATVDVVQGALIQDLNLKTFSDVQQLSPGLSLNSTEPGFNAVKLRGVDFNPSSASLPTVDIYFNEMPLDAGTAFRAMYDVGQIEVLRGPQGTLRGRTSPSGAITIAAAKPSLDKVEGYFQQTLTTQDGINSQGAVSMPLVNDVLAIRVAGLFDRNDGLGGHNISNGEDERDRTESVRTSIAFRPSSALDINLTYQYLNNRTTYSPILFTLPGETTDPILEPSDRTAKVTKAGQYAFHGHIVTLGIDYDLGGAAINYIGGYSYTSTSRATDLAYGGSIPGYSQPQAFTGTTKRLTQELRLTSKGSRFWNYLFGVYYEDSDAVTNVAQKQPLFFGPVSTSAPRLPDLVLDIGVGIPNKSKNYAAFTDHRFQLTDKLQFQAGLRYQISKVNRDFLLSVNGTTIGSGYSPENRDVTYRQLTGGTSLRYQFSRDLTGYVSYGRSYRPGGATATVAAIDEDLLLFKAEKSDNYEAGLKGTLFNRRVNYSVAVYQQDFKNYQAFTGAYLAVSTGKDGVVDNNVAFTFNADARVRGIEANIDGEVFRGLTLGLSGTYNDAVFRNALAPCNDFNGDGTPDSNGTPSVPVGQNVALCRLNGSISDQAKWGASLNFEYSVPVSENREFFLRGVASYVPKRTDPFQNIRYDDLLNNSVFVGFRGKDGAYEFSVFGKNLANVATLTTRNAAQIDYSVYNSGYAFGTPVRPREFGIVGRVRF
ncbi:TonB-dependent receptor [Sphingobium sp. Sx8-8]|uniref:TonB-dependent receptor n=1 Tax=Sphingobium sp. Sx8-8 TaxID=2933617 RepID=UPI001F58C13A|nr:TonB-dependent receptor [Sphingobium sp. Sx8-8]